MEYLLLSSARRLSISLHDMRVVFRVLQFTCNHCSHVFTVSSINCTLFCTLLEPFFDKNVDKCHLFWGEFECLLHKKALFINKLCKWRPTYLQPFNNLFTEISVDIYIFLLLCKYVNQFSVFPSSLDLISVE